MSNKYRKIKIGTQIVAFGQWFEVVAIGRDTYFVRDQDGAEREITDNNIDAITQ